MKRLQVLLIAICVLSLLASCGAQTVKVVDGGDGEEAPYEENASGPFASDFLCKSRDDITAFFGEPAELNVRGELTEAVYAQCTFYITENDGVIQVDRLSGVYPCIGFPEKATYPELCDACRKAGFPTPTFARVSDSRIDRKNVYRSKIVTNGYVISYTWTSDDDSVDLKNEKSETTVVHLTEYYLWD